MTLRLTVVLGLALTLAACGFHLRRDANLPAGMDKVYLSVSGSSDFRRALERALVASDATLVDAPGPGVARLRVPVAVFRTDNLTMSGQGRISEKSVRFHVEFDAVDEHGKILVARQSVNMSREFTYSARQAIGQDSQIRALQESMVQDMVRAVMFRLEAATRRPQPATPTAD